MVHILVPLQLNFTCIKIFARECRNSIVTEYWLYSRLSHVTYICYCFFLVFRCNLSYNFTYIHSSICCQKRICFPRLNAQKSEKYEHLNVTKEISSYHKDNALLLHYKTLQILFYRQNANGYSDNYGRKNISVKCSVLI